MKCENIKCDKDHDGSYGSGRFCTSKCARSFSSNKNKHELKDAICPKCGNTHKIKKRASPLLTPCVNCSGRNPSTYKEDDRCMGVCIYCGGMLRKSSLLFCTHKCQLNYQHFIYINKWKIGLEDGTCGKYKISLYVKRYLLDKTNSSCEVCDYNDIHPITKNPIIDFHHIDGNCMNNKEFNLKVLCPNCHRKTENHGSMNKDNIVSLKERLHMGI